MSVFYTKIQYRIAILIASLLFFLTLIMAGRNSGFITNPEFNRYWALCPHIAQNGFRLAIEFMSIVHMPGAVLLIESTAVGWSKCSLRFLLFPIAKTYRYDFIFYLLSYTRYLDGLMLWLSLGFPMMAAKLWNSFSFHILPDANRLTTNLVLADLIIYFLVWSFADYWNHRFFHTKVLWNLHRLHHSATELSVLTALRNHPVGNAIESLIRGWPILLIGLSPNGLTFFNFMLFPLFLLIHSKVAWNTGWFGRWILVSPHGHAIHHSNQLEHKDKNFSHFPLWDHLFGTWYDGSTPVTTFGLIEEDYSTNNLVLELLLDMKRFSLDIYSALKKICNPS